MQSENISNQELAKRADLEPESFTVDDIRDLGERLAKSSDISERLENCGVDLRIDELETLATALSEHEPEELAREWVTLDDFLNCKYWETWRESKLGSDLWINEPERADRMDKAAEHGADGSTHRETINDQREAVKDAESDRFFPPNNADALLRELDHIEAWHELNGSLDQEIG